MVTAKTMGSLYFNGSLVAVGSEYDGGELTIGDTVPGKEITWVEVNGLLIADRCVCVNISAEQLDSLGFTAGKTISIDGHKYLCRLLKIGAKPDVPNEWDAALDATSDEDDLWHWKDAFFWGQETVEGSPAYRASRGYFSARYWYSGSASSRSVSLGFRPALEPLGPDSLDSDQTSRGDSKGKSELKGRENVMVKKKTMGSLYFDDHPVAVDSEYDGQELDIGNTVPGKEITWVEVNGLLIADRCVCVNISAEQLDSLEFSAGKTISIDGHKYMCRLLKVGAEPDVPNEWDAALYATSEDDDLWHWKDMYFWGQESVDGSPAYRARRGCHSARLWNGYSASNRNVALGFRPALEPLDPDTLDSDQTSRGDSKGKSELKGRENVMVKKKTMGSLYFNDHPVAVGSEYDGQELDIGNAVPGKEITWVEVNGLLIADRCVCVNISAEQLDSLGFTAGKTVSIDGRRYLCRLLKVGDARGVPNEWDAALDATSEDDDLWHWRGRFFWGQEPVDGTPVYRAGRGYYSARHWNYDTASTRYVNLGFRPVLEPLSPDSLDSDQRKKMKIVRDGKEIEITSKEAAALAVGLAYERAEDTVLTKLSMEFTSMPKGAIDEAVVKYQEVMSAAEKQAQEKALQAALETALNIIAEDARMPGGYVCVTAYAALDEADLGVDDETPTCVLCVEENWLSNYIKPEWDSLEKFLSEYTYDAAEGMEQAAIGAGALAFVYCDRLDGGFRLCAEKDPAAQKAMLGFISDMLNDAGYEDASNWVDAQFRL